MGSPLGDSCEPSSGRVRPPLLGVVMRRHFPWISLGVTSFLFVLAETGALKLWGDAIRQAGWIGGAARAVLDATSWAAGRLGPPVIVSLVAFVLVRRTFERRLANSMAEARQSLLALVNPAALDESAKLLRLDVQRLREECKRVEAALSAQVDREVAEVHEALRVEAEARKTEDEAIKRTLYEVKESANSARQGVADIRKETERLLGAFRDPKAFVRLLKLAADRQREDEERPDEADAYSGTKEGDQDAVMLGVRLGVLDYEHGPDEELLWRLDGARTGRR